MSRRHFPTRDGWRPSPFQLAQSPPRPRRDTPVSNRRSRTLILLAAVAAAGGLAVPALVRPPGRAAAAPQEAQPKDQPPTADQTRRPDEEAVRKANAEYVDALNRGDADAA